MFEIAALTHPIPQDAVLDRFVELLATDRSSYDERLDYFEMRFESALQRLRDSAFKMEGRRTKRLEPLSYSEDEEVSAEVEAAMAAADEAGLPNFDLSDDCRFVLEAAIDSLPLKERTVIHMMREGFPSNPGDSDKVSISKTLGMGERNVRYLRARAIAALRAAMEAGGCL